LSYLYVRLGNKPQTNSSMKHAPLWL